MYIKNPIIVATMPTELPKRGARRSISGAQPTGSNKTFTAAPTAKTESEPFTAPSSATSQEQQEGVLRGKSMSMFQQQFPLKE